VRLALFHTTHLAYDLFRKALGGTDCCHIVDEWIFDLIRADPAAPGIGQRLDELIAGAAATGATTLVCTCSSTSPYLDAVSAPSGLAIMKIDDPACRDVAMRGGRVGVVCSVETTVESTIGRIRRFAGELGTRVEPVGILARGAFDALSAGDGERHDALVLEAIAREGRSLDRLLLAQASLTRLADRAHAASGLEVVTTPGACLAALRRAGLVGEGVSAS
jgi:hypothetical protein